MRDVIESSVKRDAGFRILPAAGRGQPGADDRARISQPLHAAGRGRAVGAGDRRQRQPRHPRPVQARPRRRSRWSRSARKRCATQIKTIGLFNTKAKNVIALSEALIRDHGGEVPRTREELETLPGVGRKTANVVLNTAFGAGDVRGRHAHLPGRQPHRPRARQDPARGRAQARQESPRSRSAATRTTG